MRGGAYRTLGVLVTLVLRSAPAVAQQDLGHRVLGTLGLDAGSQAAPGLYFADVGIFLGANQVNDQQGQALPVGPHLSAFGEGVGVAAAIKLPRLATYVNFAMSIPVVYADLSVTQPTAHATVSGIGNLFVQPLRLGWRWRHFDLVGGYGFYVPTGRFEIARQGGTIAGSQWTHELTAGGTVRFDRTGHWRGSLLASYDMNSHKQGVDVTLGNTLQIQGGFGAHFLNIWDLGVVGYALWQTTGDVGSAVTLFNRAARDRAFALGPELDLSLTAIRSRLTLRYEHDFAVRSGLVSQVVFVSLTILATDPPAAAQ